MKRTIIMLLIVTLVSCQSKTPPDTKSAEKQQAPPISAAPHTGVPTGTPPAAGTAKISVTGTVLETIDVPGGMYLRLKTSEGETWAAVNKASVKKGSEVTIVNAVRMDGFESTKLKRKFDHIVFGNLSPGSDQAAAAAPPAPAPADKQGAVAAPHAAVASSPSDNEKITVKKAEGADGKTVAEIFSAKASLKDKTIAVRGKVVKYNGGIMGKNWLHLRDGSGSTTQQNNDMTVTTEDTAAVGDVVLVRGNLKLDRDFGSGYVYTVIIEDAKVTK